MIEVAVPPEAIEAMRTVRIFFGAAVASREGLRPWIHAIAREQFDKAKDQDVKVEALNLLGLVVSPHDLDRLLEHVTGSPPDLYDGCRPLSYCNNCNCLGLAGMRPAFRKNGWDGIDACRTRLTQEFTFFDGTVCWARRARHRTGQTGTKGRHRFIWVRPPTGGR